MRGLFVLVTIAVFLTVGVTTYDSPARHKEGLQRAREACLAKGGQFGIVGAGHNYLCLEPSLKSPTEMCNARLRTAY